MSVLTARRFASLAPLALCGALSACAGLPANVAGALPGANAAIRIATDRPSLSDDDEARLAQQNATAYEGSVVLSDDVLLEQYLTAVSQRLISAARSRPFAYRVRVVDDPAVNAFTFGGGLLYANVGLIARMENEAQLAMVLAHEIAHVAERHIPAGIEQEYRVGVGGQLLASASGLQQDSAFRQFYQHSLRAAQNGHGRARENEADELGLEYLVRAGYDPREGPRALEQLYREYGDPSSVRNFFYGDHPTTRARAERLAELVRSRYAAAAAEPGRRTDSEEFRQRTRAAVLRAGVLDYEDKRYRTARSMLERVAPLSPGDPVPHYYLGKIVLETGGEAELERAVEHLRAALDADPEHAPSHRELGLAHYRRREWPQAVAALERYLALEPGAADAERIRASIQELRRR